MERKTCSSYKVKRLVENLESLFYRLPDLFKSARGPVVMYFIFGSVPAAGREIYQINFPETFTEKEPSDKTITQANRAMICKLIQSESLPTSSPIGYFF